MVQSDKVEQASLQEIYLRLLHAIDQSVTKYGLQFLVKDNLWNFSAPQIVAYLILLIYPPLIIRAMAIYSDNFVSMMYCLTTSGIYFSVSSRLYSFKYNWTSSRNLTNELNTAFKRMEKSHHIRCIIEKYLLLSEKVFVMVKVIFTACASILLISSMLIYLSTGEKLLPYEFSIPGIDHTTTSGYLQTFCYQIILTKVCLDVVVCSAGHFFCHMVIGCGHLEVLKQHFRDFNDLILDNEIKQDRKAIRDIIRHIVIEHQSHLNTTRYINEFCSIQEFIVTASEVAILIILVFVILSRFWIQGFGLIFACTGDIFAVTFMGTLFTISCEQFEQAVYNSKWYCLPADFQRDIVIILRAAQYPVQPSMGGFLSLELRTFVICMKQVYTVTMLLLNFVY